MFHIRPVRENDISQLHALTQLMVFINLPQELDLLQEQVMKAVKTFQKPSPQKEKNYYIFVLEDLGTKQIVGASMIHGKHGTEKEPHFFLKVSQEYKYSKSINTGFIHGTLKLGYTTDGYSEIGGLILHPDFRGHKDKLGKLLSYSRFLFIGLFEDEFTDYIHSELMPPLDPKGNSPLWEAIGRRFLNMDYQDADLLSRKNKEFILSLFPSDTIYETLLSPKARNAIGKVGDKTIPVKNMLEKVGFVYTDEVDPFDGGPHYRAKTKEIEPIKKLSQYKIEVDPNKTGSSYILATNSRQRGEFDSMLLKGILDKNNFIITETNRSIEQFLSDHKTITGFPV